MVPCHDQVRDRQRAAQLSTLQTCFIFSGNEKNVQNPAFSYEE